jgi:hypothetical protein
MKASETIQQIQRAVSEVEEQGIKQIETINLHAFLNQMLTAAQQEEAGPTSITPEQAAHNLEVWKAQLTAISTFDVEMFKSVIESGQAAVKSAILINGGAAAALLAFAGSAITKWQMEPGSPLLTAVGDAMVCFMLGVATAGFSSGFRYLSQASFASWEQGRGKKRWFIIGRVFQVLSVASGLASFILFVIGGLMAYCSIITPTVVK